jgi:hypothetical protein
MVFAMPYGHNRVAIPRENWHLHWILKSRKVSNEMRGSHDHNHYHTL